MSEMTTTGSAHSEHCYCQHNTGGLPVCCHCGAIRPAPASVGGGALDETLLRKAVADRDARPWRYYRFEREELKKWLEKLADERDASADLVAGLRQELQEAKDVALKSLQREVKRANDAEALITEYRKKAHETAWIDCSDTGSVFKEFLRKLARVLAARQET